MISKEDQYKIYAGTRKDDYSGWTKHDTKDKEGVDLWSLDIGNGYSLDRVTTKKKGLLTSKILKITIIRRDRTVADPEGDYCDSDFFALFDVDFSVSDDAIKFVDKHHSYVLLSREPIDWDAFAKGVPKFEDDDTEENWSSFYR